MPLISVWYKRRLEELLGFSDDILEGMVGALLDPKLHKHPDPVSVESQLEGFLDSHTRRFVEELMTILVEAGSNPSGIPMSTMSDGVRGALAHGEAPADQAVLVLEAV